MIFAYSFSKIVYNYNTANALYINLIKYSTFRESRTLCKT